MFLYQGERFTTMDELVEFIVLMRLWNLGKQEGLANGHTCK
ncbi:hypothetical protein [Vibrio campbellii]|nr:hypothetical protein [Vibrio campbellii]